MPRAAEAGDRATPWGDGEVQVAPSNGLKDGSPEACGGSDWRFVLNQFHDLPAPVSRHFVEMFGETLPEMQTAVIWGRGRAKIRGVESYSMVASEKELGISEEHEGIILLDDDAPGSVREVLVAGGDPGARGAVFTVYAVLAVMGLVPALNTVFGFIPIHGHDVWLHAVIALAAALVLPHIVGPYWIRLGLLGKFDQPLGKVW